MQVPQLKKVLNYIVPLENNKDHCGLSKVQKFENKENEILNQKIKPLKSTEKQKKLLQANHNRKPNKSSVFSTLKRN